MVGCLTKYHFRMVTKMVVRKFRTTENTNGGWLPPLARLPDLLFSVQIGFSFRHALNNRKSHKDKKMRPRFTTLAHPNMNKRF